MSEPLASSSDLLTSEVSMGNGAMSQTNEHLRQVADALIAATNAFDVECALSLFTQDAVNGAFD